MNKLPANILIISGPTCTFKTRRSIEIAKILKQAEIINCDSLLFYRELNISTAKPAPQDLLDIPHHLINCCSIKDPIDIAHFCKLAIPLIDEIHSRGHIALLVGGSAFYLRALIKGHYLSEDSSRNHNDEKVIEAADINEMINFLKVKDPQVFESIHPNDHYRVERAYQFYIKNNRPISEEKKRFEERGPYNLSAPQFDHWHPLHIHFDIPKEEHYSLIKERTSQMINQGIIVEIQELLEKGHDPHLRPLQSIGPKQVIDYLKKEESPAGHEILRESIFIATRQLAKAQRTFFKRMGPKLTFHPLQDWPQVLDLIEKEFKICPTQNSK